MRQVVIAPQAEAQILLVDSWWRENRLASPDLFAQELANACATIAAAPEVGHRYPHPNVAGVRRLVMRATRHHLYYVMGDEAVVVVAVWGAIKGSGPDLSRAG